MVSNQHYIELYVEGQLVEFETQTNLNLRLNNVLFNPTKASTNQAEYSYSFKIPSTNTNNKIFDFANILAKTSKFHTRYNAELYVDGELLFNGSLTVGKYDGKDKVYECNLVNIKNNTLEAIFGDDKMTDSEWYVPFEGASTINSVNDDMSTKYFFPMVCYGAFVKDYVSKDSVGTKYTPKHLIDKYNIWRWNDFYPSMNVLEMVKKYFEHKGYKVKGTAYTDKIISEVYASTNLADEQVPEFNLGFGKFGYLAVNSVFNTSGKTAYTQSLNFPYERVQPAINASNRNATAEFNFSDILYWDLWDSNKTTVTLDNESYMYDTSRMIAQIFESGWYKILLQVKAKLNHDGNFNASHWTTTYYDGDEYKKRTVEITPSFKYATPFEIQLVRNVDSNLELIKGKWNVAYATGVPNQETYTYRGGSYTGSTLTNRTEWLTSYPHENNMGASKPTNGSFVARTSYTATNGGSRNSNDYVGFLYDDGEIMPYDPCVSEAFICGFSTYGGGVMSVIRGNESWCKDSTVENDVFADVKGLSLRKKDSTFSATSYSYNEYKDSTNYIYCTDDYLTGLMECCVWLNSGDILELVGIARDYTVVGNGGRTVSRRPYNVSGEAYVTIEAVSTKSKSQLQALNFNRNYQSDLPKQLNLFNFTNNDIKISEWITNVLKAFNLDLIVNGNEVSIDINTNSLNNVSNVIDIDDRVNSSDATAERITYPKEMAVKYKINKEEYGFELTVPADYIDKVNWDSFGDSGYTVINLSDDAYETSTQEVQTDFSYTFYDSFTWREVTVDGTAKTETGTEQTIRIPILELSEYMAEGFNYEEAQIHDGYSLTQRFWFRQPSSPQYVTIESASKEKVYLCYPLNSKDGVNLSYKNTEKSILTEYFDIKPMLSSNYVTVDVYISPIEYKDLKNKSMVHFDSDLYYISEISGYDPSGKNETKLKLLKKV